MKLATLTMTFEDLLYHEPLVKGGMGPREPRGMLSHTQRHRQPLALALWPNGDRAAREDLPGT